MPSEFLQGQVDPVYNMDEFAEEAKFELQTAHCEAKKIIDKIKIRNKENYDEKAKPIKLKINDKVKMVKEPYDKHNKIYSGPYVVKDITQANVTIFDEKTNKTKTIHKNRIRIY